MIGQAPSIIGDRDLRTLVCSQDIHVAASLSELSHQTLWILSQEPSDSIGYEDLLRHSIRPDWRTSFEQLRDDQTTTTAAKDKSNEAPRR